MSTFQQDNTKMASVDNIEHITQQNDISDPGPLYDHDDIHEAALADNPTNAERPSWSTLLSIGFLGLSVVAPVSCGFIVVTSVLYDIGLDLGNVVDLGWVVSGWSIASSVSFSLAGSLSDVFGRRNIILLGQLVSLVGSITASVARTLPVLIAGSTLLGFSAGLILVYAAVPEILPNKYRGLGLAWIEGCLAIPWVAIAFLLGNLLILHATWRWIYYICIIYSVVCFTGTAIFYYPPPRPRNDYDKTRYQQFLELDWIGFILYTGGLTSFLLGLSWGGNPGHPWNSASVVAPIIIGAVSFIGAFLYDFMVIDKAGRHALFPRDLMSKFQEFTVSLVVVFVAGMVYYSMAALLPEATEFVYTNKPLEIGILLLPNGLGQTLAITVFPAFLHKTGHPTRYILAAVAMQLLFTALYAYGIDGHKAAWVTFQFFGASCFGLITITTVFNASLHVRPSELGVAVGLLGTFRSMGGSVGNAIFGAILRSVVDKELAKRIIEAALALGYKGDFTTLIPAVIDAALGVPGAFAGIEGVTPAIEMATLSAYHDAYAQAFKMVFYSTIPFGVVALIAAFFIKDTTKYMTNHVHVYLVKDVLRTGGPPKQETADTEHQVEAREK